ncbi:hypothetical protein ILUMI_08634 [Ignelater luminosus]|uniref:Chitin-binding type-2 domain-containing protein n=1 Tax=Ignelater luminosus TaxID=2038154 RepID=A0A8K0D5S5_IGNLU|nr:hypothetical protein ILUMI_08634 [Ignelater luminosus]
MKHLYKCFNHCHSKVLYTFIAMICLNMYFGQYLAAYAASLKNSKRTLDNTESDESLQAEDSEIFTCHSRGTFENVHNHNSYWYCDMTPDGGYVAIRRTCPNGQSYDTDKRKCVSLVHTRKIGCLNIHKFHKTPPEPKISYVFIVPETTTTTECSMETEAELPETEFVPTFSSECTETTTCPTTTTTTTTCRTTTTTTTCRSTITTLCPITPKIVFKCDCEGAFPDPESCHTFYICHKKAKSPNIFEKIKVRCPDGMAFDFKLGWCSPQAAAKCQTIKPAELGKFLRLVNLDGAKYARSLSRHRPREGNLLRILRERRQHSIPIMPIHFLTKRHIQSGRTLLHNIDKDSSLRETFQCSAKGRFPDPENHNDYYICYPKELGGYLTLKMKCPRQTTFDVDHLTCIPNVLKPIVAY